MRGRVVIGRDVNVLRESAEGLELAGRVRLRPGYCVDVLRAATPSRPVTVRRAVVCSWMVVSLGSGGPTYRGTCRWD